MDWDVAQLEGAVGARGPNDRSQVVAGYVVLPSDVRARWVDPTLMATRTFVNMWTRNFNAQNVFAACGLIMWSDVNDVAPANADAPDPLRDGDLDWINRWVFLFDSGAGANQPGNSNVFDITHLSKAKRRFGQDQGLLFVASAVENAATDFNAIDFMADVRALIKE